MIDKPFALDLAEAKALVELAEKQQRLLSIFHTTDAGTGISRCAVCWRRGAGASRPVRIPLRPLSPRGAPALARGGRPGLRSLVDLGPISWISRSSCSASRTGCRRIWASSAPGPGGRLLPCGAGLRRDAVILHGSCLVSAVMPRFVVHGSQGLSSSSAWTCRKSSSRRANGLRRRTGAWIPPRPAQPDPGRSAPAADRGWRGGDLRRLLSRCLRRHPGRRGEPGAGRRGPGGDGLDCWTWPGERPAGAVRLPCPQKLSDSTA